MSIFIPEVFEELDRSAATKFRGWVFESGEIFFRAVVCNHQDKDDFEFTEGYVFFTRMPLAICGEVRPVA